MVSTAHEYRIQWTSKPTDKVPESHQGKYTLCWPPSQKTPWFTPINYIVTICKKTNRTSPTHLGAAPKNERTACSRERSPSHRTPYCRGPCQIWNRNEGRLCYHQTTPLHRAECRGRGTEGVFSSETVQESRGQVSVPPNQRPGGGVEDQGGWEEGGGQTCTIRPIQDSSRHLLQNKWVLLNIFMTLLRLYRQTLSDVMTWL